MTLPFDHAVPADGYAWWYLDVLSPEADLGFTAIVFVGSVFSPHYARARHRGPTDPAAHAAVNLALYRPGGKRWVMSEYAGVTRDAAGLQIGSTTLRRTSDGLHLEFDERTAPFGRRVTGRVDLRPACAPGERRSLDPGGAHTWWPVAPVAHATVELTTPGLRFSGEAYHDTNYGARPLEADFVRWTWSRIRDRHHTDVLYDCEMVDGTHRDLSMRFGPSSAVPIDAATPVTLPRTGWRVPRPSRTPSGSALALHRTLEDTPFYNRSWVVRSDGDDRAHGVHESLDLVRFQRRWVQCLLPFKTRRR